MKYFAALCLAVALVSVGYAEEAYYESSINPAEFLSWEIAGVEAVDESTAVIYLSSTGEVKAAIILVQNQIIMSYAYMEKGKLQYFALNEKGYVKHELETEFQDILKRALLKMVAQVSI